MNEIFDEITFQEIKKLITKIINDFVPASTNIVKLNFDEQSIRLLQKLDIMQKNMIIL